MELEIETLSIDVEAVDDGPPAAVVQGLNGEQLSAVAMAKLGAEMLRVAAVLAAAHPLAAEDEPC